MPLYLLSSESLSQYLYDVLSDIQVKVGMHEIIIVELRIVGFEELRIIGDYRTVEMVVAAALVKIVTHAGVEYEIRSLVEKILDMSVSELCGVAYRIRGYGMLSEVVHIS